MAITADEQVTSRKVNAGISANREWIIKGTSDQGQAMTKLQSVASGNFASLARDTTTVEPIYVDVGASGGVWRGTVGYKVFVRPTPAAPGDSFFNFDTGGGTQHITQSLGTVGSYASGASGAATGYGAINTTYDGGKSNVEGVDIIAPEYRFSETHILPSSTVTLAYRGILFGLSSKVNDASFKGTDRGECLFLNASGQKRGADDWEITFNFSALPNRSNFSVGTIIVSQKLGWEYMWVKYEAKAETGSLVQKPKIVHVERVYEFGDFSTLAIGT